MYVHPHLSTVTYFPKIEAPTLILNCCVHKLTGEYLVPNEIKNPDIVNGAYDQESNSKDKKQKEADCSAWKAFVSWPQFGKHSSFDGRVLHASPGNLLEERAFERQIQFAVNPKEREGGDGIIFYK